MCFLCCCIITSNYIWLLEPELCQLITEERVLRIGIGINKVRLLDPLLSLHALLRLHLHAQPLQTKGPEIPELVILTLTLNAGYNSLKIYMSEFMKPCQIWGKRFHLAVGREAFAAAQYPVGVVGALLPSRRDEADNTSLHQEEPSGSGSTVVGWVKERLNWSFSLQDGLGHEVSQPDTS